MARALMGKKKRNPLPLDEFGGTVDGGLAILDQEGRLIHMTPSRVAGALRYFLARVQLHDSQGMPERLALTSALVGEGVTYVTRSLAAAIAYDTEASVVIVDLTFRRPRAGTKGKTGTGPASAPESATAPGAATPPPAPDQTAPEPPASQYATLADAVEKGVPVDDIIIPTSNPRLCLVQAGIVPVARRPALTQGRALASVLDQLDERFDHVLLDLPPVLVSSDAMNMSQLADAFVLVVRQGATTESQVEAALEELQGGESLGVILNRFDSHIPRRLRRLVGT